MNDVVRALATAAGILSPVVILTIIISIVTVKRGEAGMRGVRPDRVRMGPPAHVPDVRSDALLRLVPPQARQQACPRHHASRGGLRRAGGALALLLPGRRDRGVLSR